jgi:hypothetical protein
MMLMMIMMVMTTTLIMLVTTTADTMPSPASPPPRPPQAQPAWSAPAARRRGLVGAATARTRARGRPSRSSRAQSPGWGGGHNCMGEDQTVWTKGNRKRNQEDITWNRILEQGGWVGGERASLVGHLLKRAMEGSLSSLILQYSRRMPTCLAPDPHHRRSSVVNCHPSCTPDG